LKMPKESEFGGLAREKRPKPSPRVWKGGERPQGEGGFLH